MPTAAPLLGLRLPVVGWIYVPATGAVDDWRASNNDIPAFEFQYPLALQGQLPAGAQDRSTPDLLSNVSSLIGRSPSFSIHVPMPTSRRWAHSSLCDPSRMDAGLANLLNQGVTS